jgi:hypothetical protein
MAFHRLYYHLVWATRNREHLIRPEIEARLFAYLVHRRLNWAFTFML